MNSSRIKEAARAVIAVEIANETFPGAAYAVGNDAEYVVGYHGRQTYSRLGMEVDDRTLWDMASVSKVVGTTTAAMLALDEGLIDLDDRVSKYVSDFRGEGKSSVTLRDLLLHESGLPAYANLTTCRSPIEARSTVLGLDANYEKNADTVYSCMGFITLQQVVQSVFGLPMDRLLDDRVFGPLGMMATRYRPEYGHRARCAPTSVIEDWRRDVEEDRGFKRVNERFIQGEVHDPAAFMMGGVSGNAGLFSAPEDIARFAQMMLKEGEGPDTQVLCAKTVNEWTQRHANVEYSTRGFGWDTKNPDPEGYSSAGTKLGPKSFGHTGYTGTSLWIDPEQKAFVALFTNRVHPDDSKSVRDVRPKFSDAVMEAWPD